MNGENLKIKPPRDTGKLHVETDVRKDSLPAQLLPTFRLRKILIPLDFSDGSKKALANEISFAPRLTTDLLSFVETPVPIPGSYDSHKRPPLPRVIDFSNCLRNWTRPSASRRTRNWGIRTSRSSGSVRPCVPKIINPQFLASVENYFLAPSTPVIGIKRLTGRLSWFGSPGPAVPPPGSESRRCVPTTCGRRAQRLVAHRRRSAICLVATTCA